MGSDPLRLLGGCSLGLLAAVILAGPAAAQADVRFEGQTSQDRAVVIDAKSNGAPEQVEITWHADCGRPGYSVVISTTFRTPMELSTRRRFRDGGTYRDRAGRNRLVIKPHINGRRAAPRRWVGRFRADVVIRRAGRVRDRCSVSGVRWRARRVPTSD